MEIKSRKAGPDSELIDVDTIYFARYRIRNLSSNSIENLLVGTSPQNKPKSIWFNVSEAENQNSPEWNRRYKELSQSIFTEDSGFLGYPIPYLNPYSETKHEVYLDLSSYDPLKSVEIVGGAKGIKFVFKNLEDV